MARRLATLTAALVAAVSLVGWAAAPAVAHPTLVQAAPAPGLVAPSAPSAVTLALTEAPVERGSRIVAEGLDLGPVTVEGSSLTTPLRSKPEPGVYTVKWVVLGSDGHSSSGRFTFGVAGKDGAPPPGAERLSEAGGSGTGSQSAAAQDGVSVVARWLLLLSVSLLFGGGLLARRAGEGAVRAWREAAVLAGLLACVAAAEGVVAAATAGVGGSFDFGLVTAAGPGIAALARLIVLVVTAIVARRRPEAWIVGGGLALGLTAFDGHVLSADDTLLAALGLIVHALAAGLWLGALLAIPVVAKWGDVKPLDAARSFAPVAAVSLALVAITGVVAALREVDDLYFLQWSGYGRAVLGKAVLLLVAAAIGGWVLWRGSSGRALRGEVAAGVVIAALASLLAALPQGRGQLLPAERGNLLPGPAMATVLGPGGAPADLTLAPARTGTNRLVVTDVDAEEVSVRLASAGAEDVEVPLERTAGGFAADVDLPQDGTWYAYLETDGDASESPASLNVGVPEAPGSDPVEVLAVADLSGPGAAGCRDFLQGLQLGVGRLNAAGGLDGHRKVALLAYDDEDDAAQARALATSGSAPVALAGACGEAAGEAVSAATEQNIPVIVGDPAVPTGADAYRVAGDPAANGFASAQYVRESVAVSADERARIVRLFAADDEQGRRWVAGWRAALTGTARVTIDVRDSAELVSLSRAEVRDLLDRRRALAVGIDGPDSLAASLARSGDRSNAGYAPAPVLASGRTLSERFIRSAGIAGRIGVIRGAAEVTPDSADSLTYATAVRQLYPGSAPTLQGIRGYVTGLALGEAVKDGIEPAQMRARLAQPARFTDAIAAPWRSDATGLGTQRFSLLGANFLSSTITPPSQGGMAYTGTYFPDGAWSRLSGEFSGPPLDQPPLVG